MRLLGEYLIGVLENVNESNADLSFIVVACDWAIRNVTTITLINRLAENLPILIYIMAIIVIKSKRAKSSTQVGLIQSRCN